MSDPHPFIGRHILREARRGKHARVSHELPTEERHELEEVIARAVASGFVRLVHSLQCMARRAAQGPVAVECKHGFDACPLCDPCTCAGGPLMDLTTEGARELARLEAYHRRPRP